jgi:hypothetical protein
VSGPRHDRTFRLEGWRVPADDGAGRADRFPAPIDPAVPAPFIVVERAPPTGTLIGMGPGASTDTEREGVPRRVPALWVVPISAAIFGGILVLFRLLGIPASELTRDVTSLYDAPPWLGILSAAGVMVWVVGGAIALFCVWMAPDRTAPAVRYLLAMGTLALVVAADDQLRISLLVHSAVGIPKLALAGWYGVAAVVIVWLWRGVVRITDVPLLVTAGVLVAASGLLDAFGTRESVEDLLKFTGAAAFSTYLTMLGRQVAFTARRQVSTRH